MLNINKLLLSTVASCCFLQFAHAASHVDPASMPVGVTGVDFDQAGVQKIGQTLGQNRQILTDLANKDITVVLGDTGAGKSTLINLLAGVTLRVNSRGELITQNENEGAKIGAGSKSVTKAPYYINTTDLGIVCDLPGFDDTDGAVDDVVNAAFIRQILIGARSVKSIFVTSSAEIEAVRGNAFKRLMGAMKMFSNAGFHDTSCLLVINKMEREEMDTATSELLSGISTAECGPLTKLISSGKIGKMIKTRSGDTAEILTDAKKALLERIKALRYTAVPAAQLSMTLTFNPETQGSLVMFFYNEMKALLQRNQTMLDGQTKEVSFERFKSSLTQTQSAQLLQPLGLKQYYIAMRNFRAHFEKEHEFYAQKLLAEKTRKEADEALKQCQAAQLKQQEAAQRERLAQDKLITLEASKNEALATATRLASEANKIQQNISATQKEKEEALRRAQSAEAARKQIEQDAKKYQVEAQKLEQQKQETHQRMLVLQRAQQDAQERALQSENSLRQQCQQLQNKDQEACRLRSDIEELRREQGDNSSLRRENVNLRSEVNNLEQQVLQLRQQLNQRSEHHGGGGRFVLVQTPYGLQMMQM